MKLKYYLRGLGIGIMVAAVLMGIALGGDKERLSDAEIMARAKDLGMVESSVLSDLNKEEKDPVVKQETEGPTDAESETTNETDTDNQQEPEVQPEQETEPETEVTQDDKQDTEQETDPVQQPTEETEKEQPKQDNPQVAEEYVTLVINRGESSVSVSKSLAELGLVSSAKEYDRFLCENGYDKSIKVGTHKSKVGSTEEI